MTEQEVEQLILLLGKYFRKEIFVLELLSEFHTEIELTLANELFQKKGSPVDATFSKIFEKIGEHIYDNLLHGIGEIRDLNEEEMDD